MKIAVSALLALCLVGGAANAAKVSQRSAAKKAAVSKRVAKTAKQSKKAGNAAMNKSAAALPSKAEESMGLAPTPVPVAAPAQTSSTNLTEKVAFEEPKKWSLLIDMWAEASTKGVNLASAGDRAALERVSQEGSEHFNNAVLIRPTYQLTDNASVSVGQEFTHSFGATGAGKESKTNENGSFQLLDTYLQVAHSKITIAGPVTLKGYLRPYLPTSETSRDPERGRYLALRGGLTAGAPLGSGFELSYTLEPRYYFQKQASYKDTATQAFVNQENYRLKHWLNLAFGSGDFSAYQSLGVRTRFFHQDTDSFTGRSLYKPQQDNLYWETGVGYQIIENFGMVVGYYTETNDMRNSKFEFFDQEQYLYFVEGVLTF